MIYVGISLYLVMAFLAGCVLHVINTSPCPCCDETPNRSILIVILAALLWPAAVFSFLEWSADNARDGSRGHHGRVTGRARTPVLSETGSLRIPKEHRMPLSDTRTYPHITGISGDCGENPAVLAVTAVLNPSPDWPESGRIIVGGPVKSPKLEGPLPDIGGFSMSEDGAIATILTLATAVIDIRRATGRLPSEVRHEGTTRLVASSWLTPKGNLRYDRLEVELGDWNLPTVIELEGNDITWSEIEFLGTGCAELRSKGVLLGRVTREEEDGAPAGGWNQVTHNHWSEIYRLVRSVSTTAR